MHDLEEWRHIRGYDAYQVSRSGLVRSLKRGMKLLAQFKGHRGYLRVNLYRNGHPKHHLVHRLVAAAWLGPIPLDMQVNHRDGNRTNNDLSNLEIVTAEQNRAHAVETGLIYSKGEANPRAKLKEAQVREMRRLRAEEGASISELARRFIVTERTAYLVITRQTWKHLD
jgi:hypothetical protein